MSAGVVEELKLINIISMSVTFLRVAISVIVLPEPGGPQSKNGRFSLNQLQRTS